MHGADGADVDVQGADGARHTVRAEWVVARDGGRSTVRELVGLKLEGVQYEGRYVIVDIEQDTTRPVERLAWFDPPSNPGSTLLMHRQPDNIWRIDYQVRHGEDPAEAVKPENVLPRVQSHLLLMGETAPCKPLWISIYNAKCLTLDAYRHGRVLFAGDAAHLLPIFGVRGLNSGLDDAGNLAWKLALVVQGQADGSLLNLCSDQRVHAARQNIAYGSKSTEFMAPPHAGFKLMREAALRLATESEAVRSLINPRQSTPISYPASALNGAFETRYSLRPGEPAPDAVVQAGGRSRCGPTAICWPLGRSRRPARCKPRWRHSDGMGPNPWRAFMSDDELDRCYTALSIALGHVGADKASLMLATLTLGLLARHPDAQAALLLIEQAERVSAD